MNSQQEYEIFMAKLMKAKQDIIDDFNHLSPENQRRFAYEVNALLRGYGYTITLEDLMRRWFR